VIIAVSSSICISVRQSLCIGTGSIIRKTIITRRQLLNSLCLALFPKDRFADDIYFYPTNNSFSRYRTELMKRFLVSSLGSRFESRPACRQLSLILNLQVCDDGILIYLIITLLDFIHHPVFYLKLNSTQLYGFVRTSQETHHVSATSPAG
jgi:hypothetical protein